MFKMSSTLIVLNSHLRLMFCIFFLLCVQRGYAQVIELNSTGGTTATNGLHFYIENTTHMQVRRLNNTGQVYDPARIPPHARLDNGVFIRANGLVYGPSFALTSFSYTPSGGMYSTSSITATSPPNPSSSGVQQSATNNFGITAGPQVSVIWKYTTPLDFLTAEVTLTIPAGYPVSVANPVRYYHVFDTYLGGFDEGCGVNVAGPPRIVGTYSAIANACPTSTSLPAAGTIIESFRERTGTFSSYCAQGYRTFFTNGAPNCAVSQAAAMSNSIVTTVPPVDTGIGIAYNFTTTGTFTFSYDFVIGTNTVPAYDHIEIRHDGNATLCPENVTVLACTSATVPCPALSIVNTGALTGSVSLIPVAPGVTFTPSTFSIGGAGTTANVVLQGTAASAGTYTLAAAGMSQAPLNGTKCTNAAGTAATSCNMTFANSACISKFECLETSSTYNIPPTPRNPLFTKLANTGFKFDVVAVGPSGAIATGYVGSVNVELYDDSAAPTCTAAVALGGSQVLTFAAADNGRKALASNFTLANAYKTLRCRVKETAGASPVSGCSSDAFTVRPSAISTITSTANADNAGSSTTNTPIVKAGNNFSLTAGTGVVGYDGIPKINPSLLEWLTPPVSGLASPGTGTLAGLFTTAANGASGNGANGAAFTYNEVGYFRFKPLGVYDDTFTANSSDIVNGDCTNDASNVLNGAGKYGCNFGNTAASNYFGRFVPDHFTLVPVIFTNGCSANSFTYMDQPFNLQADVEARNVGNTKTFNYSGVFGKATMTTEIENANNGIPILSGRLTTTSPTWVGGTYAFSASNFSRIVATDGPYDSLAIGLRATDPDVVLFTDRNMQSTTTSCTADAPGTSSGNCTAVNIATTIMRQGRVRLTNAFGSERLSLPVPMKVEYYAGPTLGWVQNAIDTTCTVPVANNFSLSFPAGTIPKPNNLAACETALSVAPLKLSAPGVGNSGWTDVTLNLGVPSGNQCVLVGGVGAAATTMNKSWLQFNWTGSGYSDPKARANFGIYKKANEFIYLREVH